MGNCDIDIATHKKSGSKQSNRMLKALQPDFFNVDERSIADLITSTNALSQHIHFYDKHNIVTHNWSPFFQWETTSVLAQITQLDITNYINEFQLKKRALLFIPQLADQQKAITPFFENISKTITNLFDKVEKLPSDFQIKNYFINTKTQLSSLLDAIITDVNNASDLAFTFQNHLFNKKVQNLFGLLKQWQNKSKTQLDSNLESYPKHSPQYALYLTFLKLFGYAQTHLNSFTERHLDFYYNKILNLYPENAQPDSVHLCMEPHKKTSPFLVERDRIFLAGKDSNGNAKYYKATSDLAVNQAKVAQVYGSAVINDVYHFQDNTDLNTSGNSWKAFPQDTIYKDIGLAIASPLLYLQGGERTITITLKNVKNNIVKVQTNHYECYVSGEAGWYKAAPTGAGIKGTFNLTISAEEQAIVPFNKDLHEGVALATPFPVLKIVPVNGTISKISFEKITVEVDVNNYKQFKLFSNTGLIDHTKSFEPFGAFPKKGNELIFTCKEFFQKKNASGKLKIMSEFFDQYIDVMPHLSRFTFLKNGKWLDGNHWNYSSQYAFNNQSPIAYDFSEDEALTTAKSSGYAKFILTNDYYKGNGYLEDYINAAKNENTTSLPYKPNVLETSLDYSATATYTSQDENIGTDYELFHIYPLGHKPLRTNELSITPVFTNQGEMYIGIAAIKAGNSLSLLFQVAEGTANPRQDAIDLTWQYLHGQEWKTFENKDFGDDTNGLTQSGIITLNSPENLKLNQQTEWPSAYWWIKVEAQERIDAICDLVGIHSQALKATLYDADAMGITFIEHTDANTISKLQLANNHIKKINQPYISFGGKQKESQTIFYQRTSERLRHKGRAITTWDYEKLVLDKFPEVHQVKCLNHHKYHSAEINNSSAGYVTLIPIAQANTSETPNYWKPLVDLGTMKRIEDFVANITSPHARIAVKAPQLEKIELTFNVKYVDIPGADTRLYNQQLQDTINSFLSPWAYTNKVADFQKAITKSTLIHLIMQQHFVDYISDFKANQLILENTSNTIANRIDDVEHIVPKTDFSLFIPHTHNIEPLDSNCCS